MTPDALLYVTSQAFMQCMEAEWEARRDGRPFCAYRAESDAVVRQRIMNKIMRCEE